jgi:hypothetical protein
VPDEEPFGHLPDPEQLVEPDELLDPRVVGSVLPVRPPPSATAIPQRYRRSAGASVLAAGLIGLRDVIDPVERTETVIEQEADQSVTDRAMEVYLDPDDPSSSMVVIRDPADRN